MLDAGERLEEEYSNGTETVPARLARPGWKISQASKYGRVSEPVGALKHGGCKLVKRIL